MEKQIAAILQSSMAVEEQGKTLTKAEQLTLKGRACKKNYMFIDAFVWHTDLELELKIFKLAIL